MTTEGELPRSNVPPARSRGRARRWGWILGSISAALTLAGWLVMDAGWSRRGIDARSAGAVVFFVALAMAATAVVAFVLAFVGTPTDDDARSVRSWRRTRWVLAGLALVVLLAALGLTAMSWLTVMMPNC